MKKSKKVRNVEFTPDVDHWGSLIASAIRGLVQEEITRAFDDLDAAWAQGLEPGAWFEGDTDFAANERALSLRNTRGSDK